MAHLVKIQDCVTRYEKNLYHYQSAFIRLKKKRREDALSEEQHESLEQTEQAETPVKKEGVLKRFFGKRKDASAADDAEQKPKERVLTVEEKLRRYKDELFSFQLKWASSTAGEISELNEAFSKDALLRYLIEQIPDNYFVFYKPIVTSMNAPVELDIIIAGPAAVWVIVWLDEEGIVTEESKRFWHSSEDGKKIINPHIRMQRMTQAVLNVIQSSAPQLSLKKAVIAREAFIDVEPDWRKVLYIDKREFTGWMESIKKEPAPVKSQQLKFVSGMLAECVTNSLFRHSGVHQGFELEEEEEKEGLKADSVE